MNNRQIVLQSLQNLFIEQEIIRNIKLIIPYSLNNNFKDLLVLEISFLTTKIIQQKSVVK